MTFGVNNTINCVNQSALRTDLTSLELLQLTGSECQFNDKCAAFSVACQDVLPAAACNTGRFVYITSECKYYFSNGSIWTDNVNGLVSSAWGWGDNLGKLGNNATPDRSSPVSVVGGFTDWLQVSAGGFSLAIRSNGTARAWGNNTFGQLGDNTTVPKSSPVSVVGNFTDWCQISAGNQHSLGVRQNGSAWSWGNNSCGQLGDNTTVSKSSPVSVGGILNWSQISAGITTSLAIREDGTLWSWGQGTNGQLGTNSIVSRSSPVSVVGGFCDWCQISAGCGFSLAVRTTGSLWAWGTGTLGQLGDDTATNRSSPVSVVGGFLDWCQASAGQRHSAAVRTNGTLWAWGCNVCGQLGDDSSISRSSPVSVVGGFTNWCQVSSGDDHSVAIRQDGTVWAWGGNSQGELGDNSTANKSSPVSVVGGYTDWWNISAGQNFTLAIRKSCGF